MFRQGFLFRFSFSIVSAHFGRRANVNTSAPKSTFKSAPEMYAKANKNAYRNSRAFIACGSAGNDESVAGPEGLEPSTNCSAGSHSVQAELWAQ